MQKVEEEVQVEMVMAVEVMAVVEMVEVVMEMAVVVKEVKALQAGRREEGARCCQESWG